MCAKKLNEYDFGLYNYTLTFIFLLAMFSDFGISLAASKFTAEYKMTFKNKVEDVFSNGIILIVTLSSLVSIIAITLNKYIFHIPLSVMIAVIPLVFLTPISSLYDGVYRGLEFFKKLSIITFLSGIISLLFVYYFVSYYGLNGALFSQTLYYLILVCLLSFFHSIKSFSFNKEVIILLSKYSLIIGLSEIGLFLYSRVNIIMLKHFGLVSEIGYYEFVNKLLILSLIPFTMFAQVLAPKITGLYSLKKIDTVIKSFDFYMKVALLSGFFFSFLLYLFLPTVSGYFFSHGSNSIIDIATLRPLSFVLITQSVGVLAAVGFSTSTGHAKLNLYFLFIFGFLNAILGYIMTAFFGFKGMVYVSIFIKLTSDILFVYQYKKILIKNEKNNA
jgi:O-antigen/teichoic acid export membrane protein